MPPAVRLGDKAQIAADAHGCPACPHPAIGPAICGSPDVQTNSRPAIRKGDPGVHAACCNTNSWNANEGSATVFINNKEAVRQGDATKHCGGNGKFIEGSSNVMIGGGSMSGGGGSGGGGGGSSNAGGSVADGGGGGGGAQTQSSSSMRDGPGGGASAMADMANSNDRAAAKKAADDEPQPVVVSAKWSKDRVPASTEVTLSAVCAEMNGKSATFTIRDADDDTKTIASVSGSCGDATVEAKWTTPKDGPPGRFVFTVAAEGKEAASGVLTMVNVVELTLFLDEEPAKGVRVKLRVDPSGEIVRGEVDDRGVVKFEEAPFGDYTLLLDDVEGS